MISVRYFYFLLSLHYHHHSTHKSYVGCGKTSLIRRWDCDKFDPDGMASVGMNYVRKTIKIDRNTNITLRVWDTAGQERFGTIVNTLFKNADGVLLCFDLSDPESLRNISSWRRAVLRKSSRRLSSLFLVGMKKDIQHLREVLLRMICKRKISMMNMTLFLHQQRRVRT